MVKKLLTATFFFTWNGFTLQGDEARKLLIFFHICVFNVCPKEANAVKNEAERDFYFRPSSGDKKMKMIGFHIRSVI